MLFEHVSYTFRELVELMREHTQSSDWPPNGNTTEWYSTGFSVDDYRTGKESETSIHYSRQNKPNKAKYWRKAAIVAGIIK